MTIGDTLLEKMNCTYPISEKDAQIAEAASYATDVQDAANVTTDLNFIPFFTQSTSPVITTLATAPARAALRAPGSFSTASPTRSASEVILSAVL